MAEAKKETTEKSTEPRRAPEVKLVPLADLKHYPGNPRQGDVGEIIVSLQKNEQYRPIVIDKRDMKTILAGNHTALAARQLGWKKIAVTFFEPTDDEHAKRVVAVDNRTNDLASYDTQALLDLLSGMSDLEGTGYTGDDLDELLSDLQPPDFDAAQSSDQGQLDKIKEIECPKCHHKFPPGEGRKSK